MTEKTENSREWQSLKKGDSDQLSRLYNSYFDNLFEYGMRICRDRDITKDAIHDLFVKLWTNRSKLADVVNVKAYLLVSLRRMLYNKLETLNRVEYRDPEGESLFEMNFNPETVLIRKEDADLTRKRLLDGLESLNARQKEIIYLRYFEELDYQEIADVMGITVKASYKLSARAMDKLKEILNISHPAIVLLLAQLKDELF